MINKSKYKNTYFFYKGVKIPEFDGVSKDELKELLGGKGYGLYLMHCILDIRCPVVVNVPTFHANDLEDGHIDAILEIPNGFGHSLHATPKRLSIWANGVNAMKGSLGSQYLMQTVMRALPTGIAPMQPSFESSEIVNCELTSLKLLHSAEPASSLCSRSIATLSIVNYYNPTMDYKHFMIPALMIMVMVMVGGFLPALNLVSEKELGTIEQINVTPVSRLVFTLSKLIPFWIICLLELALCMTLAFLVYGLPVAGSVGAIFLAALLFIIIMSSIGVIIANLSETMQQTMFLMQWKNFSTSS